MTGMVGVVLFHPLIPCQALGQALVSSSIKGEGDSVGCFVLLSPIPVDSRLRGNDGEGRVE